MLWHPVRGTEQQRLCGYAAIPFEPEEDDGNGKMEIGYIVKKNQILSSLASLYIEEMKQYLKKGIERIW